MRKISLSGVAILALFGTLLNANSFEEALVGGKISGEFAVTFETRDVAREITKWNNYYSDTAYSVGSFALKYETGTWNNLSLTTKVRAYTTIFEGNEGQLRYKGFGDAAERFWETRNGIAPYDREYIDFEELYLSYYSQYFSVVAGRQFLYSDWLDHTQDAINVNAQFKNTSIEAVWTKRLGRVSAREYFPLVDINGNDGAYKLGVTQKFTDNFSATVYDLFLPTQRDILGGKANFTFGDTKFSAQYAANLSRIENEKDSSLIELKMSTLVSGFTPFIGYLKIDEDQAFTAYSTEEIVNVFEEGDKIYERDASTYYVGVSKDIWKISATLLYGNTSYINEFNSRQRVDETTLWLAYPIIKNLKANLGYTYVDTNDSNETDLNQLNVTLAYSF